ncbi:MAG: HDOD domain-containing protein [Desulfovibrionaceae bacterium]|nr:HDOD domain-containing protein [Desulfovibrionaceae bacterium]MBF0514575.1 HDOD domain-containing protein [Desulfovibrionaceae bacterium]
MNSNYYAETFFARQPIFDAAQNLWGHELLYRHGFDARTASFAKEDKATFDVIVNYSNQIHRLDNFSGKVIINFTAQSILDESHYALAPGNSVLKVTESGAFEPAVMAAIRRLKADGYMLAVECPCGRFATPGLAELTDIAVVDALSGKCDLPVAENGAFGGIYLAKRVEDETVLETAKKNGFSLFQGFYFEKPEIVPGRKLSSSEISRFNLLKTIEEEDPDFAALTQTIQADAAITYRLLSYLNSAHFGQPVKIESIRHAIVLLGWKHLRNWLRLLILTDILPPKKTKELLHTALIRGLFLENCAQSSLARAANPSNLYLLGLFSLLDTMLSTPMDNILSRLPLDEDVKTALSGGKNDLAVWLELVLAFEAADWKNVERIIAQLELGQITTAKNYYDALIASNNFFGFVT